jgi:hypothetical protein
MTTGPVGPAAERLEGFLARLGRLNVDDLAMIALPEPDPDVRVELLQRAMDAAAAAGRREELAAAPGRARDALVRSYSRRGYEPTWFGLNWGRSLSRPEDRARLIAAVEDAAVAAVVADLLSAEDVAALREPFDIASSMAGAAPSANPIVRGSTVERSIVVGISAVAIGAAVLTGAYVLGGAIVAAGLALAGRRRPAPDRD